MDVKKFLKEATGQDIISKLEELAQNNTVAALEDLKMRNLPIRMTQKQFIVSHQNRLLL
jgi:hypothetical protein